MSDRAAFLAAVRAAPDDDLPRLVFADWLDEHGDPLGEFIRVQLELHPIRDHLDDPRAVELTRRQEDLLRQHRDDWLGPVADLDDGPYQFGPVFVRGLPERVCVSLDTLLRRGEDLFAACPTVREVAVFGVAGRGRELADCPHLRHVQTLEIADWIGDADAFDLVGMPRPIPRLKVWFSGWNNPLLAGLTAAADETWPERIDLVQHYAGSNADADLAGEGDIEVGAAGRKLVRRVRPFEGPFPLSGDVGHGFYAGHTTDGTSMLVRIVGLTIHALYFDWYGGYAGAVTRRMGFDIPHFSTPADILEGAFGLTPGLIRVRDFRTGLGHGVSLWPARWPGDYFRNPFDQPPTRDPRDWRNRGGVIRRWLEQGRFVIEWDGQEYYADKTGTIVGP
jgi:uncharacterized protein (TIGR02996 family)